jgi:predicted dehydrogenase
MGNQGNAGEGTRQIREWVEAGAIGTVREVQYWTNRPIWPQGLERPNAGHHMPPWLDWDLWLGPAPERPFHPAYAPFNWRGWWDFGTGALGDMACHGMDAAVWTLALGYPSRIEPESTRVFPEAAPTASRIVYEFPARSPRPAVKVVWRDGSLSPPRPSEVPADAMWPPFDDGGQLWIGDDGKLVADILGRDPRLLNEARDAEIRAKPPEQKYPRVESVYAEWIAACKGGPPAGSSFAEHAGPLTEMPLLGVLAARAGRTLEINPQTGEVTNLRVPKEWIEPEYRKGWSLRP